MKKITRILSLIMLAFASLVLVACGETTTVKPTDAPTSAPTEKPTEAPTEKPTEAPTSAPTEAPTEPPVVIDHRVSFVRSSVEGAVTRAFNEEFDTMIDDFSSSELVGTSDGAVYQKSGVLRTLVDNESDTYPNSADAAIYKMATGSYELENYEGIGFTMRVVGVSHLELSNLVLALRGGDDYQVYEIKLSEALNPDGEALPALSAEFQDFIVSPNQSIEDDTTVYLNKDGSASSLKVLDDYLGFHLYALNEECSAVVEISQVFIVNAGEKTVLDSFDRALVNKTDASCWWRDSASGFIVQNSVLLNEGHSYTTASSAEVAKYSSVVLNVLGDLSGLSITPVYGETQGTAVAFESLKDPAGASVKEAVNGAFTALVIDLVNSGIEVKDLTGFKVTSTKEVYIHEIYMTSMQTEAPATIYPTVDSSNALVFDNFSRVQSKIDASYDEAVLNTIVQDAGLLNYAISYHGADDVSVDGDCLVFKPTTDYTQVVEGAKADCNGYKYLVFVMKLEGDGDLANFRIDLASSGAIYANSWLAASGLNSVPADLEKYDYVDEDGYAWYIIDLEKSGFAKSAPEIIMYYTGTATLKIDSIFYANSYEGHSADYVLNTISEADQTIDTTGYKYEWGGKNSVYPIIGLSLKGDGVASLLSFRMAFNGKEYWAKDGLIIRDKDGNEVDYTALVPTDVTVYYINLLENGFELPAEAQDVNLHFGGFGDSTGTLVLDAVYGERIEFSEYWKNEVASVTYTSEDYGYLSGGKTVNALDTMIVSFTGDGVANLNSWRIEFNGKTLYLNKELVATYANGTTVDFDAALPTTETVIYIDLVASGFELLAGGDIHFHFGQSGIGGTVTVNYVKGASEVAPASAILASYQETVK